VQENLRVQSLTGRRKGDSGCLLLGQGNIDFSVSRLHGQTVESPHAPFAIATMHPSSILRAAEAGSRQEHMAEFINDLRQVAVLAAKKQAA